MEICYFRCISQSINKALIDQYKIPRMPVKYNQRTQKSQQKKQKKFLFNYLLQKKIEVIFLKIFPEVLLMYSRGLKDVESNND